MRLDILLRDSRKPPSSEDRLSQLEASGLDIFLRLVHVLVGRKRFIAGCTFLATAASVVAVLLWPSSYKSIGTIKPPRNESGSSIEAMLKDAGGGLGGLLGSVIGGVESGEDDCITLFGSNRFARLVIDRFDLETVYKLKGTGKKYFPADVLKRFYKNAEAVVTDEGALQISFKDRSADRARDVVAFMILTLDSLYTDIQRKATIQKLSYVDLRVSMAEAELKRQEDSLAAFQIRHNLFLPELQVQSIVENAARTELEIEDVKEELAMEAALRGTSGSRYQNLLVRKRLLENILSRKIRSRADSNSLVLPVRQVPMLATEFFRLERAYRVKLGLYKYLIQQAEALKLDADKNIQVISVIDPPWANEKRVSPKRRIIVEAVFILSFLLSAAFAVFREFWTRSVREGEDTRRLLEGIRQELTRI